MREPWYQEMMDELAKHGWTVNADGNAVRIVAPGTDPSKSQLIDIPMREQPMTTLQRSTIAAFLTDKACEQWGVDTEHIAAEWLNDRQLRLSVVP